MKPAWILTTAAISLTLAACGANKEAEPGQDNRNPPKQSDRQGNSGTSQHSVGQIEHMHGMDYSQDGFVVRGQP